MVSLDDDACDRLVHIRVARPSAPHVSTFHCGSWVHPSAQNDVSKTCIRNRCVDRRTQANNRGTEQSAHTRMHVRTCAAPVIVCSGPTSLTSRRDAMRTPVDTTRQLSEPRLDLAFAQERLSAAAPACRAKNMDRFLGQPGRLQCPPCQ